MNEKEWIPPDNFYKGYSLYQHFGYGPEGELNLTKNLLQNEGYPTDSNTIKETLELTRDLSYKIQELCETEIREYAKLCKTNLLVGGTIPFPILVAKGVVKRILEWISGNGKSLIKKLTGSEEERVFNKLIEKLQADDETNEIIIKQNNLSENLHGQ